MLTQVFDGIKGNRGAIIYNDAIARSRGVVYMTTDDMYVAGIFDPVYHATRLAAKLKGIGTYRGLILYDLAGIAGDIDNGDDETISEAIKATEHAREAYDAATVGIFGYPIWWARLEHDAARKRYRQEHESWDAAAAACNAVCPLVQWDEVAVEFEDDPRSITGRASFAHWIESFRGQVAECVKWADELHIGGSSRIERTREIVPIVSPRIGGTINAVKDGLMPNRQWAAVLAAVNYHDEFARIAIHDDTLDDVGRWTAVEWYLDEAIGLVG